MVGLLHSLIKTSVILLSKEICTRAVLPIKRDLKGHLTTRYWTRYIKTKSCKEFNAKASIHLY